MNQIKVTEKDFANLTHQRLAGVIDGHYLSLFRVVSNHEEPDGIEMWPAFWKVTGPHGIGHYTAAFLRPENLRAKA